METVYPALSVAMLSLLSFVDCTPVNQISKNGKNGLSESGSAEIAPIFYKAVLINALSSLSLPWRSVQPDRENEHFLFDLSIKIDTEPINCWNFVFLSSSYGNEDKEAQSRFLGDLYFYRPSISEKISVVFTDVNTFSYFTRPAENDDNQFLNATLSAIWLDHEGMVLATESYVAVHEGISEETAKALYIPTIDWADNNLLRKLTENHMSELLYNYSLE